MTMAEKQYKNYDERFLKEDSSSSEPIEIESTFQIEQGNVVFATISQYPDGAPISTSDDLLSLLGRGNVVINFTHPTEGDGPSPGFYKIKPSFAVDVNKDGTIWAITQPINDCTVFILTEDMYESLQGT